MLSKKMELVNGLLVDLEQTFDERGYPIVLASPAEDDAVFSTSKAKKLCKRTGRTFEVVNERLLRWNPSEEEISEVMSHIYVNGWGGRVSLSGANACCPRCADRNRNGQSVSDECKYCADVPDWALKLEELGLAYMVLDGGWHWEIYRR